MTTTTVYPSASDQDGTWIEGLTTLDSSASTISLGDVGTPYFNTNGFFRFVVSLANGITINEARLRLTASGNRSSTGVHLLISAIDAAGPSAPTTYSGAEGATRTTASVSWNPSSWTLNTQYESPDIAAVIQELVDSYTVTAIVIYVEDDSSDDSNSRQPYSYDNGSDYPELYLDYTYTLTASQGSFSLTGQSTGLVADRTIAAAQGSYSLTGQATGLLRGFLVTAAQGSFALTGQDVGLLVSRLLAASQGSYVLNGQTTGLLRGFLLTAAQGSYNLSGQTTGLLVARLITITQGSYTLTGIDVILTYSGTTYILTAAQGSFTLTGETTGLLADRTIAAAQGSFSLSGQAVGLLAGRLLATAQGSYALTGQDVSLLVAWLLTAAQGSYALTGQAVTFDYSGVAVQVYTADVLVNLSPSSNLEVNLSPSADLRANPSPARDLLIG